MNNKFYLIIFVIGFVFSKARPPLCISLGAGCGPALTLRDLEIREEAYPFDWVVSPFSALYKALCEDFKYYLSDIRINATKTGVADLYGFQFTHDWPTISSPRINALEVDFVGNNYLFEEWEKAVPFVKAKYQRRIERFRSACKGNKKIFFIRWGSTKEEALILRDFFITSYPELDFVLIVGSNNVSFIDDWQIPRIKNFYSKFWHNPGDWLSSFKCIDSTFNNFSIKRSINYYLFEKELHYVCCKIVENKNN